jgi:hypothetical protein
VASGTALLANREEALDRLVGRHLAVDHVDERSYHSGPFI